MTVLPSEQSTLLMTCHPTAAPTCLPRHAPMPTQSPTVTMTTPAGTTVSILILWNDWLTTFLPTSTILAPMTMTLPTTPMASATTPPPTAQATTTAHQGTQPAAPPTTTPLPITKMMFPPCPHFPQTRWLQRWRMSFRSSTNISNAPAHPLTFMVKH